MQKTILLLSMVFLISCGTDKEQPTLYSQKAQLVGVVKQPVSDKIFLKIGNETLIEELSEGKFHFEIDLNESVYVMLANADQFNSLFLRPGDSLNLSIDFSTPQNDIQFNSGSIAENEFLNSKKNLKTTSGIRDIQLFDKKPHAFKAQVLKYQNEVAEQLKRHISKHSQIDPLFKKQQELLTKYEMGSLLLDYPLFKNEGFNAEDFPDNYFDFLSEIDVNNAVIQNTLEYKSFVKSYISRKTKLTAEASDILQADEPLEWTKINIDVIESEVTLPKIRASLITDAIEWHLHNHACVNIDNLLELFRSTNPDPEDAGRVNRFATRCRSLRSGKIAPSFSGVDLDGKVIDIKSFVGKNIYIDVWATWCGPCKKETPHFEKLIDKYRGNSNLEFITVSFDEKSEIWKKVMTKNPRKGIQLIAPKAFKSKMAVSYGISNIPRFILIDKEGKLINADAPLPSSEEIKPILAKLAAS